MACHRVYRTWRNPFGGTLTSPWRLRAVWLLAQSCSMGELRPPAKMIFPHRVLNLPVCLTQVSCLHTVLNRTAAGQNTSCLGCAVCALSHSLWLGHMPFSCAAIVEARAIHKRGQSSKVCNCFGRGHAAHSRLLSMPPARVHTYLLSMCSSFRH